MTTMTVREAMNQLEQAEEALKQAKRLNKTPKLAPEQYLAEHIHNEMCTANHVDHCAWYYETWDQADMRGSTRGRYIKKAKLLLGKYPLHEALTTVKVLKEFQAI